MLNLPLADMLGDNEGAGGEWSDYLTFKLHAGDEGGRMWVHGRDDHTPEGGTTQLPVTIVFRGGDVYVQPYDRPAPTAMPHEFEVAEWPVAAGTPFLRRLSPDRRFRSE